MRSLLLIVATAGLVACAPGVGADSGTGGGSVGGGTGVTGGGGGGGSVGGGGGVDVDAGPDLDAGPGDAGGDAGVDGGCALTVQPASLTFGPTVPGCVARGLLAVRNACSAPEVITLTTSGPFTTDAGTLTLAAGAAVDLPVWFAPFAVGPLTGVATVTGSTVVAVPLSGLGDGSALTTDTFRAPTRVRTNVLFVVSDGPGMTDAQQALAANFPSLLQYAQANQLDFRLGIIAGRADGGSLVGGVITPNRPNAAALFGSSIALGSGGTPTASCLDRAVQQLSTDAGWLIPRASFSLVCVQNTLEQSPSVPLQALATLTGDPTHLTVNGLANFVPGCPAPDDVTLRGLVDATSGAAASICRADAGLGVLESVLGGYENTFVLSRPADATAALEVRVDGVLVPAIDPGTGSVIWAFDVVKNTVVFTPPFEPAPGATVTVRYARACLP